MVLCKSDDDVVVLLTEVMFRLRGGVVRAGTRLDAFSTRFYRSLSIAYLRHSPTDRAGAKASWQNLMRSSM